MSGKLSENQKHVCAAVVIAHRLEMRAVRREQRERVSDGPTVNGPVVVRLVIGGGRPGVEFEPGQVECVVLAKEVDRVGEDVTRRTFPWFESFQAA